jgi:hypothetical protein
VFRTGTLRLFGKPRSRTLPQHILIGYSIGMGIYLAHSASAWPPRGYPAIMELAGLVIVVFAIVLSLLNLHHSSRMAPIMNVMTPMRSSAKKGLHHEAKVRNLRFLRRSACNTPWSLQRFPSAEVSFLKRHERVVDNSSEGRPPVAGAAI